MHFFLIIIVGGGTFLASGVFDNIELGRRQAIERELEATPDALGLCNAAFDDSGNMLVYGSLMGIKILNLVTNKVVRTLGSTESGERFLSVALYQGIPRVDTQFLLSKAGGAAEGVRTAEQVRIAIILASYTQTYTCAYTHTYIHTTDPEPYPWHRCTPIV